MSTQHFSCMEAKQADLIEYLQKLGYKPTKVRGEDYWFYSPFRNEKTPSFKINRKKNLWFDFGKGIGGTIIDFGIEYYKCSVQDFLLKLKEKPCIHFSFHQPILRDDVTVADHSGKIVITDDRVIADPGLRKYLETRNIPLVIANRFCSEVTFELYGKKHLAIGFNNDASGYELRNEKFKGSSSPKSISIIQNDRASISVFEGFFDFLSYQTLTLNDRKPVHAQPKNHESFLVLNSLAFFEKNRMFMETYHRVNLYLDRDDAGTQATSQALNWSIKFQDQSHLYQSHKDLNEHHISLREKGAEYDQSYGNKMLK